MSGLRLLKGTQQPVMRVITTRQGRHVSSAELPAPCAQAMRMLFSNGSLKSLGWGSG